MLKSQRLVRPSVYAVAHWNADGNADALNSAARHFRTSDRVIAIGTSIGGTEAIKDVLVGLAPDTPGTLITQQIPKALSAPFARRMSSYERCSQMTCVKPRIDKCYCRGTFTSHQATSACCWFALARGRCAVRIVAPR